MQQSRRTKTANITKMILLPQHIADMLLCYEVLSSSRWWPSPYWIFSRVTADHPQSANECLRLVLKFRLDRIYIFGDVAILMFLYKVLAWNCLFMWSYPTRMRRIRKARFEPKFSVLSKIDRKFRFLEKIESKCTIFVSWAPNGISLRETSFGALSVKIGAAVLG